MRHVKARIAAFAATLCLVVPPIAQAAASQPSAEAQRQRQQAARSAEKSVDKDATTALEETRKAAEAIASGNTSDALAAIERATGKVDILVARKPGAALVPVETTVEILDLAPRNPKDIDKLARQAENALDERDYAEARRLLDSLASELRLRTYHLPLATYPDAMRAAARLLEQKKSKEAAEVLRMALDTLVVVERRTPLPLLLAETAVDQARAQRDSDKEAARKRLVAAKDALERARILGYTGETGEYAILRESIAKLDQQLTGTENTDSAFASLKSRLSAFVDALSDGAPGAQKNSETASR